MLMLVFFDDPLCFAQPYMGLYYSVIQGTFESLFIAMLLMFWLLYIHAISANTFLSITAKGFFIPKVVLCFLYFVYLITMRIYVFF